MAKKQETTANEIIELYDDLEDAPQDEGEDLVRLEDE